MSGWEELRGLSSWPLLHDPWALVGALAALGMLIGFLTGLFGVGGAFLLVPMMNVLYGIPYPSAIGSSLSFTIGSSAGGMMRHARMRNFEPRSMLLLGAGAMGGALVGAAVNGILQDRLGSDRSHAYTMVMHGLFVGVLLLTAYMTAYAKTGQDGYRSFLQRLPLPPRIDLPRAELHAVSAPGLLLMGLGVGVMTGLLGIGGGVLFVPLLIFAVGLTPHRAVGTSLGAILFGASVATTQYGMKGDVKLWLVMALLAGSTIGIQIGAAVCERLHARRLKRWFAVVVVLAAAAIAADLVRKVLEG